LNQHPPVFSGTLDLRAAPEHSWRAEPRERPGCGQHASPGSLRSSARQRTRASGGSRTHAVRFTGAALGLSSIAGGFHPRDSKTRPAACHSGSRRRACCQFAPDELAARPASEPSLTPTSPRGGERGRGEGQGGRWESNPQQPVHSRVPKPLWVRPQYPWQESNLLLRLRRAVRIRYTTGIFSTSTRNRTWTCSFGESHDVRFTTEAIARLRLSFAPPVVDSLPRTLNVNCQFRGLESDQHSRLQRPLSYLLDDPGINQVAREGLEPSRPVGTAF
jgi:hypothetical protein